MPLLTQGVMGVGGALTDDQVKAQQLARRMQITNALSQSAMGSSNPAFHNAGGRDTFNFMDPITKDIDAYLANKRTKSENSDQSAIFGDMQKNKEKGLDDFFNTSAGTLAGPSVGPPSMGTDPDLGTPTEVPAANAQAQPGDSRRAIIDALKTGDPLLQQLALTQNSAMNKNVLTAKDFLDASGFSPESKVAAIQAGGDVGQLKHAFKGTALDGRLVDENGGPTSANYGAPGQVPGAIPGQVGQENLDTHKYNYAPAPPANTNIGPKIDTTAFEGINTQVGKGYDQFNSDQKTLQNIATARQALATLDSAKMGPLADLQVKAAQLGAQLGFNVPQTADREALNAALGQGLIGVIRQFAPVSDTDAARAMQIVGGAGSNSKEGLGKVLDQQENTIGQRMTQYQKLVRGAADMIPDPKASQGYYNTYFPQFEADPPGAGGIVPTAAAGSSTPATKPAGVIDFNDYAKQFGGSR